MTGRPWRPTPGRKLHAGDGLVWLHRESEQFGLASPETVGWATSGIGVIVDDIDRHYDHVRANGADIVHPPSEVPYGYREYSARGPEGGLWSFMQPHEH